MDSSFSESSSLDIPAVPYLEDIQYPNKEPSSESEYLVFFNSLFTVNLCESDQQMIKAYCAVLEKAPISVREQIKNDERIEAFLHCCIARADVEINDLIEIYAPCGSEAFANLIPVLVWVFVSQKSNRFVEPLLVKNYEELLSKYQKYLEKFAFVNELSKLLHQPISNNEKVKVILLYFCVFLYNVNSVTENAVKCFFCLVHNLVNGVEYPNPDLRLIDESYGNCKFPLQQHLEKDAIIVMLQIITAAPLDYGPDKKRTIGEILKYTQKEIIPEGFFLAQFFYLHCDNFQ